MLGWPSSKDSGMASMGRRACGAVRHESAWMLIARLFRSRARATPWWSNDATCDHRTSCRHPRHCSGRRPTRPGRYPCRSPVIRPSRERLHHRRHERLRRVPARRAEDAADPGGAAVRGRRCLRQFAEALIARTRDPERSTLLSTAKTLPAEAAGRSGGLRGL